MDSCDVLIVGGGPAGSSCAWKLRDSGLRVTILDKQVFPRDKVCGGWITPGVLTELEIDPAQYARGRVLQPITGFLTRRMDGPAVQTFYGAPISYGIRRREFDDYLLKRSGARLVQGIPLTSLERSGEHWIANGQIRSRLVVGSGGHFCPVARLAGAKPGRETVVVAQEAEFEMDDQQVVDCHVRPDIPELYFCSDLRGYGWCFRKQNFLNVGLGRMDPHRLPEHVSAFFRFLRSAGRLSFEMPSAPVGHAYLLYGSSARDVVGDSLMLTGDAAGLAYPQSGEGIRPAIESGLLAAKVILAANGRYSRERLESYRGLLVERFGKTRKDWTTSFGRHLPALLISSLSRHLLGTHWFAREVVLNRWFLHRNEPILSC
jgi:geranylgeranyl reductase family protein